jgi:hypothetical protein
MGSIFFIIGFIWIIAAPCSILIGPLVGLNREKIKNESMAFWGGPIKSWIDFCRKVLILFVVVFLFAPIVYPGTSFFVGFLFIFVAS